jgi:2-hydroxy-3-keto-5-methylthiopentenyl-1-phosphate phosphatase
MSGKVHILEHPIWSDLYKESLDEERDYSEMNNLYVAGIDSIDIGANETSVNTDDPSKFCIVIKKRAFGLDEPKYVAYYKDRPNDIREAYKIAMCLALYYKAIINIEATRVSMLTWAKSNGFYKYFMARPKATYPNL